MVEIMTTTGAAKYFTSIGRPVQGWQIRRVYETGVLPEPDLRMGSYRIIKHADLPLLENALIGLGYIAADGRVATFANQTHP